VTALLEYDSGATMVFAASTGEAPGTNRLEIAAENGRVVMDNGRLIFTKNETPMSEHRRTATDGFSKPKTVDVEIPCEGVGGQHVEIMQNFVDTILKDAPLIAPAEEGIHSVELANAMLLSSFEKRTVELPFDAAHYEKVLQRKIADSPRSRKT
jgi:predicted dehydrogenase